MGRVRAALRANGMRCRRIHDALEMREGGRRYPGCWGYTGMSSGWFEIGPRDLSPDMGELAEREPPRRDSEGLTL